MKLTTINQTPLTMSSREIADLTGKRHDHVIRDIRAMLEGLNPNLGYQAIQGVAVHDCPQTKRTESIDLDKRHALILVSGYSVQMRAAIIDRWQELERQPKAPALPSHLETARLLVTTLEDNDRLSGDNSRLVEHANRAAANALNSASVIAAEASRATGRKIKAKDVNEALCHLGAIVRIVIEKPGKKPQNKYEVTELGAEDGVAHGLHVTWSDRVLRRMVKHFTQKFI